MQLRKQCKQGKTFQNLPDTVIYATCDIYYHKWWAGWFPHGSSGEESACNAGDPGSIPGSERSPGEGDDCSLKYSHLENYMDRGAWRATVHGVAKSQTRLSDSHTQLDSRSSSDLIRFWIMSLHLFISVFLWADSVLLR